MRKHVRGENTKSFEANDFPLSDIIALIYIFTLLHRRLRRILWCLLVVAAKTDMQNTSSLAVSPQNILLRAFFRDISPSLIQNN